MRLILALLSIVSVCSQSTGHIYDVAIPDSWDFFTELNKGWTQCRAGTQDCINGVVPGTVLTALLRNGSFSIPESEVYYSENMASLPDISKAGAGYYTFTYLREIDLKSLPILQNCTMCTRLHLHIRGVNYRATVLANNAKIGEEIVGMFNPTQRILCTRNDVHRAWDCGARSATIADGKHTLKIMVKPPDRPGKPSGQGGDHFMASQTSMQYTQGWDWAQPTPDRATGIWDKVFLEATGSHYLRYPRMVTHHFSGQPNGVGVRVTFSASIKVFRPANCDRTGDEATIKVYLLIPELNISIRKSVAFTSKDCNKPSSEIVAFDSKVAEDVSLWWPHTHGEPRLYNCHFVVEAQDEVHHKVSWRQGFRTAEYDYTARKIIVNGVNVFGIGDNWIGTDQLLRRGSLHDYRREVGHHQNMGLNWIRIWGGGLAERPEFYAACDEMGMMVMQDLWRTGDCNGRWAGSPTWPLDDMLSNVRQTALMLRTHPSLVMYTGGNEVSMERFDLHQKISQQINTNSLKDKAAKGFAQWDDGTSYIRTTMDGSVTSSQKFANGDGPYTIQSLGWFYSNARFAPFNPEMGSVSMPVVQSLQRFLSPEALKDFPKEYISSNVGFGYSPPGLNREWAFHKYLGFGDNNGHDHIYQFGTPTNIEEYCVRAQLAQYYQFKHLFEGTYIHMNTRWNALLFWKGQTPWPSLRGGFYDYYGVPTGGYYGVRSALANKVQPMVNFGENGWPIVVANRNLEKSGKKVKLSVKMVDLAVSGAAPEVITSKVCSGTLRPNSVSPISDCDLAWPAGKSNSDLVLIDIVVLNEEDSFFLASNRYITSYFTAGQPDLSQIAQFRREAQNHASITARALDTADSEADKDSVVECTIEVANTHRSNTAMFVRLDILQDNKASEEWRWFISDSYFSLLPGESRQIQVSHFFEPDPNDFPTSSFQSYPTSGGRAGYARRVTDSKVKVAVSAWNLMLPIDVFC